MNFDYYMLAAGLIALFIIVFVFPKNNKKFTKKFSDSPTFTIPSNVDRVTISGYGGGGGSGLKEIALQLEQENPNGIITESEFQWLKDYYNKPRTLKVVNNEKKDKKPRQRRKLQTSKRVKRTKSSKPLVTKRT